MIKYSKLYNFKYQRILKICKIKKINFTFWKMNILQFKKLFNILSA